MKGLVRVIHDYSDRVRDSKIGKITKENRGIVFQASVGLAELIGAYKIAQNINSLESDTGLATVAILLGFFGATNIIQSSYRAYRAKHNQHTGDVLTGHVYPGSYDTIELVITRHAASGLC